MLYILPHVAFLISYSDAGDNKQYKGEKGEERETGKSGFIKVKKVESAVSGQCIHMELSLFPLILVIFWSCRCCP